jgi:hypothetical protein
MNLVSDAITAPPKENVDACKVKRFIGWYPKIEDAER